MNYSGEKDGGKTLSKFGRRSAKKEEQEKYRGKLTNAKADPGSGGLTSKGKRTKIKGKGGWKAEAI